MSATLTVANSVLSLTVEGLYPSGVILTGYAADNVFEAGEVENGEFVMGIDGKMSRGFTYNIIPFTLTLQGDSQSIDVFEQIYQREVANRDKLRLDLTVTLPSTGKRYGLVDGGMRSYKAPSGQRILQPGVVQFNFARQTFTRL